MIHVVIAKMEWVSWYIVIFGITITSTTAKIAGFVGLAILAITGLWIYQMASKD